MLSFVVRFFFLFNHKLFFISEFCAFLPHQPTERCCLEMAKHGVVDLLLRSLQIHSKVPAYLRTYVRRYYNVLEDAFKW